MSIGGIGGYRGIDPSEPIRENIPPGNYEEMVLPEEGGEPANLDVKSSLEKLGRHIPLAVEARAREINESPLSLTPLNYPEVGDVLANLLRNIWGR